MAGQTSGNGHAWEQYLTKNPAPQVPKAGVATSAAAAAPAKEVKKRDHAKQLKEISYDFRSDTITMPTDAMYEAMANASRADDVYREDETMNEFQEQMAALTGKEAGLFMLSGTMSNQIAIRTHLHQPPHSVLLDSRSHIYGYEAGGLAAHSQAMAIALYPDNGHHLTLEQIEANLVVGDDIHGAPTKIVALENTLSGTVFPQDEIVRISKAMRARGIIMHCDGARLWEVAAKTGLSMKELCEPFDSVSLCFSKGLGAPIGSVLVGTQALIQKSVWFRKLFGGGVRQSGGLAAACQFTLEHHFPVLVEKHALAVKFGKELAKLGLQLSIPVETNMLWIDTTPLGFTINDLIDRAGERGIKLGGTRIVIHIQTSPDAVDELLKIVAELKEKFKGQAKPELLDEKQNQRFLEGDWQSAPIQKPLRVRSGVSYKK